MNVYFGANENKELSNMYTRPFKSNGLEFQSVEMYFQFCKFRVDGVLIANGEYSKDAIKEIRDLIMTTDSGKEIKRLGNTRVPGVRLDNKYWNSINEIIMKKGIYESFSQNKEFKDMLLNTGDEVITHHQDRSKWGFVFPKLLMEVREELRA